MSCLHFTVDRATGICSACGATVVAYTTPGWEATPIFNEPIAPPEQVIAPRAAQPQIQLPTLPDTDNIYELIAAAKKATKPAYVQAPIAAPPAAASVPAPAVSKPVDPPVVDDYVPTLAEAIIAATPDWLAAEQAKLRDGRVIVGVDPGKGDDRSVALVQGPGGLQIIPELSEEKLAELCAPTPEEAADQLARQQILMGDEEQPIQVQIIRPTEDFVPGTYPDEPVFSFLGGTAGTGKTYAAAKRVELYDDAKLVATTGIAAVNLGGITINSLLQFGDTAQLRANYEIGKLSALLRRMTLSGYYRLIVDEISMMDGHQLDILVTAIEDLNIWLAENNKRLFGMTLVGDFAQLPPINAPFVFQRPTWGRFQNNITMLTEPRRQADPDFVRALQAVRRGDRHAAMAYFGPKIVEGSEQKFDGTTIMATNIEVDRYNKMRMMDLTSTADYYKADRVGEQLSEWQKNIPDNLEMKPGALVMILANKTTEGSMVYANGDLGHYVRKLNDNSAEVEVKRTGTSVIVSSVLKEKGAPTGQKLKREDVKGSIRYMPLRVAYATTCHKSQGLSLDNVQIMYHNRFWANPGMLYVALSRARTPQGLRLVGTKEQFEARVVVNEDVRRWL